MLSNKKRDLQPLYKDIQWYDDYEELLAKQKEDLDKFQKIEQYISLQGTEAHKKISKPKKIVLKDKM